MTHLVSGRFADSVLRRAVSLRTQAGRWPWCLHRCTWRVCSKGSLRQYDIKYTSTHGSSSSTCCQFPVQQYDSPQYLVSTGIPGRSGPDCVSVSTLFVYTPSVIRHLKARTVFHSCVRVAMYEYDSIRFFGRVPSS